MDFNSGTPIITKLYRKSAYYFDFYINPPILSSYILVVHTYNKSLNKKVWTNDDTHKRKDDKPATTATLFTNKNILQTLFKFRISHGYDAGIFIFIYMCKLGIKYVFVDIQGNSKNLRRYMCVVYVHIYIYEAHMSAQRI